MIELSICFATLNRAEFLGATLASLAAELRDGVEIVIVDGGSTDETPQIVAGWQRRCPSLRYERRETNGGVDRDYAAAVEPAHGRYCWLFTDDDLLIPGAVDRVLRAIETLPAMVVVNAEVWNSDFTRMADANRLRMDGDRRYEPGDDDALLASTGAYLTFIGGVVIRKDVWDAREKEPFFGSLFIHFGVIFQAPLPAHTVVVARPLIRIRYGNAGWTARSFEIWMHKWPEMVWSMPRSESAKRTVTPRHPWLNPITLLIHRAKGSYSHAEYEKWIAGRARLHVRVIARVIAGLPFRLLNRLLRLALTMMRWEDRTTAIDLRNAARSRR
jgi:abequosyltransferase